MMFLSLQIFPNTTKPSPSTHVARMVSLYTMNDDIGGNMPNQDGVFSSLQGKLHSIRKEQWKLKWKFLKQQFHDWILLYDAFAMK